MNIVLFTVATTEILTEVGISATTANTSKSKLVRFAECAGIMTLSRF